MSKSLLVFLTLFIIAIGSALALTSGWTTAAIVTISMVVLLVLAAALTGRRSGLPLEHRLRENESIAARGLVKRGVLFSPAILAAAAGTSYRMIQAQPLTELPVVAVSEVLQGSHSEFDFRTYLRLWTASGDILFAPFEDPKSLLNRLVADGVPTRK
jgi:Kef-type K+ transport system membrane component KefB